MNRMTAVQVSKPKTFEIVTRDIPKPGRDQVRIHVKACGVCHSDIYTRDNLWPGLKYPRVPGHEVSWISG